MVFNPIYFGDEFWGFTTSTLVIPNVFSSAQLDNLTTRNYIYTLSKSGNIITSNTDKALVNPVTSSFELYGEEEPYISMTDEVCYDAQDDNYNANKIDANTVSLHAHNFDYLPLGNYKVRLYSEGYVPSEYN